MLLRYDAAGVEHRSTCAIFDVEAALRRIRPRGLKPDKFTTKPWAATDARQARRQVPALQWRSMYEKIDSSPTTSRSITC